MECVSGRSPDVWDSPPFCSAASFGGGGGEAPSACDHPLPLRTMPHARDIGRRGGGHRGLKGGLKEGALGEQRGGERGGLGHGIG